MNGEQQTQDSQPAPPPPTLTKEAEPADSPPAAPATAKQFQDVEERMTAFERSTVRWTRVAVGVSILAAIFICLQWKVMSDTLGEMKRSGEASTNQLWQAIGNMNWMARTADGSLHQAQQSFGAAVDQSRLDQRAWLGIGTIDIGEMHAPDPIAINIQVVNSGKTIAKEAVFPVGVVATDIPIDIARFVKTHPYKRAPDERGFLPGGQIVFPNLPITITAKSGSTDALGITSVQTGAKNLYVYGDIQYKDVFEKRHTTRFCGVYDPKRKKFFGCDSYIYAD
jgi:hypothetical protein